MFFDLPLSVKQTGVCFRLCRDVQYILVSVIEQLSGRYDHEILLRNE